MLWSFCTMLALVSANLSMHDKSSSQSRMQILFLVLCKCLQLKLYLFIQRRDGCHLPLQGRGSLQALPESEQLSLLFISGIPH